MTTTHLIWAREQAGVYRSQRLDGERVSYRIRRNGRRWWDVQRMRLRSKGRVTVEHVAEAPSLAYARFMAGCDLVSGARP
jgi:hypothetical protein